MIQIYFVANRFLHHFKKIGERFIIQFIKSTSFVFFFKYITNPARKGRNQETSVDKWLKVAVLNCGIFAQIDYMAHPVLLEDWKSYDNRKIKEERDQSKFSCAEHWEVEYLADKLKKYYPLKTRQAIMQAITHCCSKISSPHQRERFVECVVRRFVSEILI